MTRTADETSKKPKRGHDEGSIKQLPNSRWTGSIMLGEVSRSGGMKYSLTRLPVASRRQRPGYGDAEVVAE
jgi:hypothetical protein